MRQTNRGHHRRVALAIVGASVPLILYLSGCGSSADAPGVASARSGSTVAASPTMNVVAQYVDAQRKWVKCMREQGYDLPDPDAKGAVDLSAFAAQTKLAKTDPKWIAANQKCQPLQQPAPDGLNSQPPLTPEQIAARRNYAKCMRANGMPSWPDPGPDGQWPQSFSGQQLSQAEQEANIRALQICDPVLDGKPPASFDPNQITQG